MRSEPAFDARPHRPGQRKIRVTNMDGSDTDMPRLYVLGALCVKDAGGRDCTPKGKKAQALLALLALSPRGIRTRVWLRDKLWSDSDEEHAAGSLRQTIFELRRALDGLATQVLTCDRNALTLHLDRIWIDVRALTGNADTVPDAVVPTADLLEGLDVGDEEFEEWLCLERAAWETQRDAFFAPAPPRPVHARPAAERGRIAIGLLPSIVHGGDGQGAYIGDYITESVARTLSDYQPVDIVDFRGPGPDMAADEPTFLLRARALVVGDGVSVTFLVYGAGGNALLLSQSLQTRVSDFTESDFAMANQFVAQNVDHLAKLFEKAGPDRGGLRNGRSTLIGYHALASMFELDPRRMRAALDGLEHVGDGIDDGLLESLKAYSASFALGENIGQWDDAQRERTEKLVSDILQRNPLNSIALACVGHTMGFVLDRHDVASEIFARAIELNPMQAFVWDHLALHKLYCGDLAQARAASDKAVRLGNYSPISYTYDTTACMIATLQGDFPHASQLGARALAKKPGFHAALRYRLAALGHLDDRDEAHRVRGTLLALDPDFADRAVQLNRFRLPRKESIDHVLQGLSRAGL